MKWISDTAMGGSWRTTALGYLVAALMAGPEIVEVVQGASADADPQAIFAGIAIAILGRLARDNGVTSRQAGAE